MWDKTLLHIFFLHTTGVIENAETFDVNSCNKDFDLTSSGSSDSKQVLATASKSLCIAISIIGHTLVVGCLQEHPNQ